MLEEWVFWRDEKHIKGCLLPEGIDGRAEMVLSRRVWIILAVVDDVMKNSHHSEVIGIFIIGHIIPLNGGVGFVQLSADVIGAVAGRPGLLSASHPLYHDPDSTPSERRERTEATSAHRLRSGSESAIDTPPASRVPILHQPTPPPFATSWLGHRLAQFGLHHVRCVRLAPDTDDC